MADALLAFFVGFAFSAEVADDVDARIFDIRRINVARGDEREEGSEGEERDEREEGSEGEERDERKGKIRAQAETGEEADEG